MELVEKGDELLIELLSDAVESKSGVRPDENDISAFLAKLNLPVLSAGRSVAPTSVRTGTHPAIVPDGAASRAGNLILREKSYPYANAKDAMVILLRELANDALSIQMLKAGKGVTSRDRQRSFTRIDLICASITKGYREVGWLQQT
jgi:hypothetical protein